VETKGEGYVKQLEGKAEYRLIPRDQLIEHPKRDEDRVGLTAWIAITGEPFIAGNNKQLRAHPHWKGQYDPEHYPAGSGRQCESFLGLPLRIGDQVLGVLKVENKRSGGQYVPFDERDQQICQFLANGAAISIQNARDLRGIQEARRLEDIGSSAAAMAHGMGQYLQRIQGATDLLGRELERSGHLSRENLKQLQRIKDEVQGMDWEIKRVKEAASPLELSWQRSDIGRILRENFTEDAAVVTRAKGRAIRTQLIGVEQLQNPYLSADARLLSQAFSYLVSNALDAVSDGGLIWIRVEEAGDNLQVEVLDDGPGVNEARIPPEKLFEPFKTTKPRGMGLGLYLVRRSVEAHGGTVAYVRNQPHGACFRVTLPRHAHGEA
jgi:signal transduction histidine kinase